MKKIYFTFFLILGGFLYAQTTPPNPTPAPGTGTEASSAPQTSTVPIRSPKSNVPAGEPYQDGEFPDFLLDVQRAEIVAIGTFPFAFILSGIVYDYTLYCQSGFDSKLTPWPAGQGTSTYTGGALNDKNITLIAASVGVSLGVALLDYILGLSSKKAPETP